MLLWFPSLISYTKSSTIRPPLSLDKQQVDALTQSLNFLQQFLETYTSLAGYSEEAAQLLEMRIATAAHFAEDVIESAIADRILNQTNSADFHRSFEGAIQRMNSIAKEAIQIKEKKLGRSCSTSIAVGSTRSAYTEQKFVAVGIDDALYELLDKLTGGNSSDCLIISIVGMGGIGKSALARTLFENELIDYHFDILAWITVSQEYSVWSLLHLLCVKITTDWEPLKDMNEDELGEIIYRSSWRGRYLIVMDDIWNIEVLKQLRIFFPNNRNGSRIVITTRQSNLAYELSNCYMHVVKFLDEDASWDLRRENVFGEGNCPVELVEVGKRIAKNCSGIPLSIVVVGGHLAKSEPTQEYWEYILGDLSSVVNSEDDEHCLKILHLSYRELPVHLKPCFLYMAVFHEDSVIRVSTLVKLLVGEGILKPVTGKSHEKVAEDYVKELIDRNLILASSYGHDGKVKVCKMHDLLRDLCLREVEKQKFFRTLTEKSLGFPLDLSSERRIVVNKHKSEEENSPDEVFDALGSAKFARSLISKSQEPLLSLNLRLLRVCSSVVESFPVAIFGKVNLSYLSLTDQVSNLLPRSIPSLISLLWNLQILIWDTNATVPSEIWEMPLIKHVIFSKAELPDPPVEDGGIVLENLRTLMKIHNFNCTEEVVRRIPNIKKLKIYYEDFTEGPPRSCIDNLVRLHKLESLGIVIDPFPNVVETRRHLVQNLTFPQSLKKLTIGHIRLHWDDLNTKIGSLPLLEVLKLKWKSFVGRKWETVEGKFRSLKFLLVEFCDLEQWMTESTHFPRLEHIVLRELRLLKEIDSVIGDIPTLGSIELECCTISAVISAKTLLDEQEELGNDVLRVRVLLLGKNKLVESLASPNIQVET
ncbi:putative late blight resistance protein homolog R1B-16 [Salvia splendens]|uniref:putative late blight resistance protein homolog R1B-16 n=1 Tax=Salvia splendens TaxID=180675 RepID=UPI001C26DA4F|nr:putative late blight resistance protein homolog R1B-16 [Salvia splendens]